MSAILGRKVGMTSVFDETGRQTVVTVIEAGPCAVTQVKTPETDGYSAVQLGFQDKKASRTTKALQGHFEAAGVEDGCTTLRTDGVSVDIDGDYTETLARLEANPQAIGVFGLSFYQNNTDKLQVATMDGVTPSTETVASGEYPVSRPLYFYVKNAHLGVIPGLQEYVDFFVSDDMAGPNGPLAAYGLVSDPELAETQAMVAAGTPMGALN